jgi:hypothetical protein
MTDILPTYQMPAIEMSRAEFKKLPKRDWISGKHDPDQLYRTLNGYPNDVFKWVPIESPDAAGEWHRAPVTFK